MTTVSSPYQQQQQQQNKKRSPHHHPRRNNAKDTWWHKSVVSRTLSFVEHDFEQIVHQSPFLQRAEPGKHIALFHRSEIITGKLLGRGGFSDVYEITAFALNEQLHVRLTEQQRQLREEYRQQTATGHGRYAIKHLQEGLLLSDGDAKAFKHAASDLAVEAAYLSALDHENIIKVRGLPVEGLSALADGRHDGYFIILDRVDETLHTRIEQWKKSAGTSDANASLQEKGEYALQLASAISYLHERRIIFRDLKPHNIGFSSSSTDGDSIKLFDFGLCRELPAREEASSLCTDSKNTSFCEEVYHMSGVGTRRYMATEIFNTSQYNDKADTYSWSMIVYEMLELNKPYATYSVDDHNRNVCKNGERPVLINFWKNNNNEDTTATKELLCSLLEQSWCESIVDRLSMKEAQYQLHQILKDAAASSSTSLSLPVFSSSSKKQQLYHSPVSPVGVDDDDLFVISTSSSPSISFIPFLPHDQLYHPLAIPSFSSTDEDDDDDDLSDVRLSFKLLDIRQQEEGNVSSSLPVRLSYR